MAYFSDDLWEARSEPANAGARDDGVNRVAGRQARLCRKAYAVASARLFAPVLP